MLEKFKNLKIRDVLKKLLEDINSKPKIKNALVMAIVYFLITLAYSNLTWESLRAKVTFLNRMFYSPTLSVKEQIEKRKKIKAAELELTNTKALEVELTIKTPSISLSGIIEPLEKVEVYSKVSGRIEKIFVTEGEKIKPGQKLAKIDNLNLELEYQRQNAALESSSAQLKLVQEKYNLARRNIEIRLSEADKKMMAHQKIEAELQRSDEIFRKKQELLNAGAIPSEEFEAAKLDLLTKESAFNMSKRDLQIAMIGLKDEDIEKSGQKVPKDKKEKIELLRDLNTRVEKSEVEVAEKNRNQTLAQMKSTKLMLQESTLYSPIEGVVAEILKSTGELLDSGGTANTKSIMTLVYIKTVYASFFINEQDSKVIKEGMEVNVKSDIHPDKIFKGKVKIVSPIIDPKTHTTEIKVTLDNNDYTLKSGMFVRLEVLTGEPQELIVIPYQAVQPTEENEGFVFLIKNKTIFKTKIKLGKKEDDNVIVLEGLSDADIIATSNLNKLREGMQVNPIIEYTSLVK